MAGLKQSFPIEGKEDGVVVTKKKGRLKRKRFLQLRGEGVWGVAQNCQQLHAA
jgi:hypothetical protein